MPVTSFRCSGYHDVTNSGAQFTVWPERIDSKGSESFASTWITSLRHNQCLVRWSEISLWKQSLPGLRAEPQIWGHIDKWFRGSAWWSWMWELYRIGSSSFPTYYFLIAVDAFLYAIINQNSLVKQKSTILWELRVWVFYLCVHVWYWSSHAL